MGIGEKIDINKGKLPYKGRGLENSVNIAACSIEEQRRFGLERLAAAFRIFSRRGFDLGVAGHISFRDPEHKDHFWLNPLGYHFKQMKVSDLVLMNFAGELVYGNVRAGDAAFCIHSEIYKAKADVNSIAHAHPMYGKTFSTLGKMLDPISQDSCAFYERQAIHNHFSGVVEETEEGDRIANALGDKTVLFLQNHGILTTGPSIDIALWYYFSMERCCHSQLLADAAGETTKIPHETAIKTREFIANDLAAWASFQPLLDMITTKEPDLLD